MVHRALHIAILEVVSIYIYFYHLFYFLITTLFLCFLLMLFFFPAFLPENVFYMAIFPSFGLEITYSLCILLIFTLTILTCISGLKSKVNLYLYLPFIKFRNFSMLFTSIFPSIIQTVSFI